MAEAILQKMDHSLEVFSAGLHPDERTDPIAITVMKEIGIDISMKKPKGYKEYVGIFMDYLITLCDGTKDKIITVDIPFRHKIHLGFEDPKKSLGLGNQVTDIYRDIRDDIRNEIDYFYAHILVNESAN